MSRTFKTVSAKASELHTRSEQTRAGLAKARAAGRIGGRRTVYPDETIREAVRRHDGGETWAAAAAAVGISVDWLYARLRRLKQTTVRERSGG